MSITCDSIKNAESQAPLPTSWIKIYIFLIFSRWFVCVLCWWSVVKSLQSCLTLCDPIDGSPPGSPVPGILQARSLEWVAISFSNSWKRKVKVKSLSRIRLLATPWTAAHEAPPSMGFSRQEYWSWVPLLVFSNIFKGGYLFKNFRGKEKKVMYFPLSQDNSCKFLRDSDYRVV